MSVTDDLAARLDDAENNMLSFRNDLGLLVKIYDSSSDKLRAVKTKLLALDDEVDYNRAIAGLIDAVIDNREHKPDEQS